MQSTQRLKDLEKENKELIQQLTVDKKTLVIIREVSHLFSPLPVIG